MAKKSALNFDLSNLKLKSTPILTTLLILAAFGLGVLGTKVYYLEKGITPTVGTTTGAAAVGAPAPAAAVPPGTKVDVSDGHFPILGNKDAKVHIVEFADFRCPFCEQLFTQSEPSIIKDYVNTGKASFSFRHYAFLGPASIVAANAAECANEQGKFWDFHNYLYKNQPAESDTTMYTVDGMTTAAGTLGMNTDQFKSCLSSNKYQANVDKDFSEGQKAGVNGTPATFINGVLTSGAVPYSQFQSSIDAALAK